MARNAKIILTVADHDKNGFIHLGQWPNLTEPEARNLMSQIDGAIPEEAVPDLMEAHYWFILDLWVSGDCIDNSAKCIPTQIAMRLAPEEVSAWLAERPDPDAVFITKTYANPPLLERNALSLR